MTAISRGKTGAGKQPKPKNRTKKEAAGGQEERFLKAFDEYGDALFRHATLRISDRERAIEIVHDSYTKVWTYIRSGHQIDAFRPFLYKVLNNLIIDEYRKIKESSLDAILEGEGIDEGSFEDLQDHSMQKLLKELDGREALGVVGELPDIYREVLIMRFVDDLRPKEICDLVEETENTVSVRIHRGLGLLKKIIDEREEIANSRLKATRRISQKGGQERKTKAT